MSAAAGSWSTQYVRLIAFPVDDAFQFDGDEWWSAVVDAQAETATRKPTKREWSGTWNDRAVQLAIDPLRIEWTLSVQVNPETISESNLPSLGSPHDIVPLFCNLMAKWLAIAPKLKRLTFASQLMNVVATKDDAYLALRRDLKSVQVDLASSDLQYRINRRRSSQTTPGVEINRLCTWSAAQITLSVVVGLSNGADQRKRETVRYASILDQDINTTLESPIADLDGHALTLLFQELCDEGLRIAEVGDIPEAAV